MVKKRLGLMQAARKLRQIKVPIGDGTRGPLDHCIGAAVDLL